MKNIAVFSCLGLGDGLIALVLSNNLHLNGEKVTTYHPFLSEMQPWFPHLPILPFPSDVERALASFDHIFIFLEKTAWMQQVVDLSLTKYRHKTTILNPIATPNQDYPYWEEGKFNGRKSFVENLYLFAQKELGYKITTRSNGITPSENLQKGEHRKRIVIHPTSSREGKNWTKVKYIQLAHILVQKGYETVFLLQEKEIPLWDKSGISTLCATDIQEIASLLYTSSYFIGNDSGPGHLASCLGIPTITICRSALSAQFWRPGWTRGEVLSPHPWIPNLKGCRLRDRYWKKWISIHRVLHTFDKLSKFSH